MYQRCQGTNSCGKLRLVVLCIIMNDPMKCIHVISSLHLYTSPNRSCLCIVKVALILKGISVGDGAASDFKWLIQAAGMLLC